MRQAETIPVKVTRVEQLTPLIKEFQLARRNGEPLPAFSGGCHVVVVMPGAERTFRNPYSLMSSPFELDTYRIAVRRMEQSRGGSVFMHDQVKPGTELDIAYPVNLFPLSKFARQHILIAGGVGITPFVAMIDDLHHGSVPFELHYAVAGRDHATIGEQLKREDGDVVNIYDATAGERMNFTKILSHRPLGTHVYVCGPGGMIEEVAETARYLGWADSHIHWEQFSAPPVGEPFDVYLAQSQIEVHVPAELSLLEAIEAAGVNAPYQCRGGVCGTCQADVIECDGEILHNDHYLSHEDKISGKKIMPCISRARCKRLVLDL